MAPMSTDVERLVMEAARANGLGAAQDPRPCLACSGLSTLSRHFPSSSCRLLIL